MRQFLYPLAVRSAKGGAHAIWGTSPDSSEYPFSHADTLWYAQFDGAAWSSPEVVAVGADGLTFRWDDRSSSLWADSGDVLLAVPVSDSVNWHSDYVAVLHRSRTGAWTRAKLPFIQDPGFVSLTGHPNGTFVLGYVSTAPAVFPDSSVGPQDAVWVSRSRDGGNAWSEPVPVHRTARLQHDETPHVLVTGPSLAIVWGTTDPGGNFADTVLLATSADDGASWARPRRLFVHERFLGLAAFTRSDGAIQIAAASGDSVLLARWKNGAWATGPSMPVNPAGAPSLNAIVPVGGDSLAVAWEVSLVPTSERWSITRVAMLAACSRDK
jgi:hypothetical protein